MKKKYWKNKNVLVTGVTGFVGGNLVKKMCDEGASVFGLIRNENPFCFLFLENYHRQLHQQANYSKLIVCFLQM